MRGPFIASSLLRRSVWKSVGGFPDLRATEDEIFMQRVREHGCQIGWSPQATLWWQPPRTLASTWRRFMVFSRINIWAGRARYWHYGMARFYLVSLVIGVLAIVHSRWWLSLLLVMTLARVGKSIWQRRDGRGLLWALNPLQFLGVALTLGVIDAATFAGWAQALWQGPPAAFASSANPS